ncbi:hypothetical protein ETD86_29920 [Nonomuraea turkmeniaca]|uniref:Uncharacterized protein n=1 Tax=Nonomuraea turkmeniaca TaxID=103838 RepID=A0A5S4F9U4_9ACTN|nr:hypothetical protein [Nonomuraea turkmeniaca]TMR13785.1 hypothetical protein ETD86_29920 [Nonomuraea turkmeniaca]
MIPRRIDNDIYPDQGHMVVVNPAFTAVYWLADRHAHLDTGSGQYTVSLRGPGRRLLEALAGDDGLVTMDNAIEYNTRAVPPGAGSARQALTALLDPAVIAPVLYPPYIGDLTVRPRQRHLLPPPLAPWCRQALVLDRQNRRVVWLCPGTPENTEAVAAPLCDGGAIDWDGAETFEYIGDDLRSRLSPARSRLLDLERPHDNW